MTPSPAATPCSPRPARRPRRSGSALGVAAMPELPEVETVPKSRPSPATCGRCVVGRHDRRRPLRLGADAAGRGPGTRSPRASPVGRVEAIGRRGKLVVIELSGDAVADDPPQDDRPAVRRAGRAPRDPYVRLVLELDDGRELRFRDIRKFGRVGLYPRDPGGELVTEPGGADVFAGTGPSRSTRASRLRAFRDAPPRPAGPPQAAALDQAFLAGIGNIYADEALWRRGSIRCARPGRSGRPTSAGCTRRSGRSWPRRSSGAARRSTTTRRPTATARCRSGCTSTSGRASPARAAGARSGGSSSGRGRPTSARGASDCRRPTDRARRRILRTMSGGRSAPRRRGGRWTELAGDGALGLTRAEADRAARRARTERTKRAAAGRRAAARAAMAPAGDPAATP